MSDSLGLATALWAVILGGWCLASRTLRPPLLGGLIVLEGVLVLQALAAIGLLLRGHHPSSTEVFLVYLLTSVGLLPVSAQMTEHQTDRWATVLYGVTCLVVAVVVVRTHATWRSA